MGPLGRARDWLRGWPARETSSGSQLARPRSAKSRDHVTCSTAFVGVHWPPAESRKRRIEALRERPPARCASGSRRAVGTAREACVEPSADLGVTASGRRGSGLRFTCACNYRFAGPLRVVGYGYARRASQLLGCVARGVGSRRRVRASRARAGSERAKRSVARRERAGCGVERAGDRRGQRRLRRLPVDRLCG